jgi:hypothetical protein
VEDYQSAQPGRASWTLASGELYCLKNSVIADVVAALPMFPSMPM